MKKRTLNEIDYVVDVAIAKIFAEGEQVFSVDSQVLGKRIKEDILCTTRPEFSDDQERAIIEACQETYLGCHLLMRMYICNVFQEMIPKIIPEIKRQINAEMVSNDL